MNTTPEAKGKTDADAASVGKDGEEGPRSFTRFLAMVSSGEAESQLSYELFELGKRLQEQCKAQFRKVAGELKLTVRLIADTNETVAVLYKIDAKAPKPLTTPALFWLTKGGNLSEKDTRQLELRPREVPSQARKARDIADQAPAPREV